MDETQGMLFICVFSYFFAPNVPDGVMDKRDYMEQNIKGINEAGINSTSRWHWFRIRSESWDKNNLINLRIHRERSNRASFYHDLPPPQPRAHTWDGSYPINQSDDQDDEMDELNCVDGWVRQGSEPVRIISKKHQKPLGNKILHQILGKPHSYTQVVYNHASFNPNRYPGPTQTTASATIHHPTPQPKAPTTSHQDVSIWDALLVYDTYDLVARIKKQARRITQCLKHGWAFIG